jgi:hypothetical protein
MRLTMGEMVLDVLPDGRVLVTLPVREVPLGVAVQATAVYPNLRGFLGARRPRTRNDEFSERQSRC